MTSDFYKRGRIIFARCKIDIFYVAKILTTDYLRRRCYLRFEDDKTHWCSFENLQSNEKCDDLKCSLCWNTDLKPKTEIIFCSTCQLGFHRNCHNPIIKDHISQFQCQACYYLQSGIKNHIFDKKVFKTSLKMPSESALKTIIFSKKNQYENFNNKLRETEFHSKLRTCKHHLKSLTNHSNAHLKKIKIDSFKQKYIKRTNNFNTSQIKRSVGRPKNHILDSIPINTKKFSSKPDNDYDLFQLKSSVLSSGTNIKSNDIIDKLKMPKNAVDCESIEDFNFKRKKIDKKELDARDLRVLKNSVFFHLESNSSESRQTSIIGKRTTLNGTSEYLMQWTPLSFSK